MLIALALIVAAPVLDPGAASETPKKEKKEKRTCRRIGDTGSRMNDKRVCKTVSEWARIDAANTAYGVDANHTGVEERNRKD